MSKIERRKSRLESLRVAISAVLPDDGSLPAIKPNDLKSILATLAEISDIEDEIETLEGEGEGALMTEVIQARMRVAQLEAENQHLRAVIASAGLHVEVGQ